MKTLYMNTNVTRCLSNLEHELTPLPIQKCSIRAASIKLLLHTNWLAISFDSIFYQTVFVIIPQSTSVDWALYESSLFLVAHTHIKVWLTSHHGPGSVPRSAAHNSLYPPPTLTMPVQTHHRACKSPSPVKTKDPKNSRKGSGKGRR